MTSLRQVAEMNNSGANMLVSEQDRTAFVTLQQALRIMENQMQQVEDQQRDSSSSSAASAPEVPSEAESNISSEGGSISSLNAARFLTDTKGSAEISSLKDDRFFIFNQALLVETTAAIELDEDFRNCPHSLVCFYTSVIIFNLALAYHKRGMVTATPTGTVTAENKQESYSRLALCQSLRLYEYCLRIIRSIADYSEDCKMLVYACSYNLAHLYIRKGERTRAQQLVDGLEPGDQYYYR